MQKELLKKLAWLRLFGYGAAQPRNFSDDAAGRADGQLATVAP
jgi:hypothetical protein